MRKQQRFEFEMPLTLKRRVNGFQKMEHLGDIRIEGVGYDNQVPVTSLDPDCPDNYDVDIDEVIYNGMNVLPLLKAFGVMDKIQDAALEHVWGVFSESKVV